MIFVTVGTHEQPFNRLLIAVDQLKKENIIKDDVIIQRGYSTYIPSCCSFFNLTSWKNMQNLYSQARIIITHGGPSSFIDALKIGKLPIVVPRQKQFNEHVNDHQLFFASEIKKRGFPIIVVKEVAELKNAIEHFPDEKFQFQSHNAKFNSSLIKEIAEDL